MQQPFSRSPFPTYLPTLSCSPVLCVITLQIRDHPVQQHRVHYAGLDVDSYPPFISFCQTLAFLGTAGLRQTLGTSISQDTPLPESRSTPSHNLSLTYQLSVKFTSIQGQVDVEIHPVERPLRRIHPLKVLLEVLPRQVGRKRYDLLDTWILGILRATVRQYHSPQNIGKRLTKHPHHKHTEYPRTSASPPEPPV